VSGIGSIDDVLARFEKLTPPAGDEKRHFHGVYHRNTVAVKEDLEHGGFLDPAWVEPWDVVFANLYLDAIERWNRGEPPSGPWRIAFEAAEDQAITPLHHVLVGLNAHLNNDLPQALLAVLSDAELADRELVSRRYRDFAHIDGIVVRRVKEEDLLLREVEEPGDRTWVDRLMTPFNRSASKRFLKEARYKVWRNAFELAAARRLGPEAYSARLRELETLCVAKVQELLRPGKVLIRLAYIGYGVLLGPPTASGLGNPAGWPEEVLPAFDRYLTCAYATRTRDGTPITYPVTPYVGEDGRTLDVSCGLTSPAKAERARRNPQVCLLFADPTGSGVVVDAPVVVVRGRAAVRDADLQANTDRYVRRSLAKLPWPWRGVPRRIMRGLDWYWSRIWVRVTPERITWWSGGAATRREWRAPEGTVFPRSDPQPGGGRPSPWRPPPEGGPHAKRAARELGLPILTVVDEDGWPAPMPTASCRLEGDAFRVRFATGLSMPKIEGLACLTFTTHAPDFGGYENAVFVGEVTEDGSDVDFRIQRALPTVSFTGSRWKRIRDFASSQKVVKDRVRTEAARRGQRPPEIRIPRYR
jgi:hypothetical protein